MYNNPGNREDTEKLLDQILDEMMKEVPQWRELLKDGGLIDKVTKQREFRNLNTTQLRKFFDEVKSIDYKLQESDNWSATEAELWKLVPSIKYAAGRGTIPKVFADFISKAIERISMAENGKQAFLNFERIFESIVAYHKYNSGR